MEKSTGSIKKNEPKSSSKQKTVYIDVFTKKEIPKERKFRIATGKYIDIDTIVYIDNKPFSKYDNSICMDYYYKNYIILNSPNTYRVVTEDPYGKNLGTIKFELTRRYPARVGFVNYDKKIEFCMMIAEDAIKYGYSEDLNTGTFYDIRSILLKKPSISINGFNKFNKTVFEKTSENLLKFGEKSLTNLISESKPYTFGIEIETCSGLVPLHVSQDYNMSCEYDGSIVSDDGKKGSGGEYITGVLYGDAGFAHLHNILSELNKRCGINKSCSVHVHLGNIKFNKQFIVLLWKLTQSLEPELYSIMPPSRIRREHCKPMQKLSFPFNVKDTSFEMLIDKYYRNIIKILSLGKSASKTLNKKFNHPAGRTCGYDRSTPRYWWLNFIPAVFNIKGFNNYTIEFRMHSATLNFEKVKNWILICMGIVSYVENNQHQIIDNNNFTLEEVLKATYPTKCSYLINYINQRKEFFASSSADANEKIEYYTVLNENFKIRKIKEVVEL
jgi:hypothetical protein